MMYKSTRFIHTKQQYLDIHSRPLVIKLENKLTKNVPVSLWSYTLGEPVGKFN